MLLHTLWKLGNKSTFRKERLVLLARANGIEETSYWFGFEVKQQAAPMGPKNLGSCLRIKFSRVSTWRNWNVKFWSELRKAWRGRSLAESTSRKCKIIYPKVASRSMSWLVAHPRIFRMFMKRKFDAYVLWHLAKRFQNWIVAQSTARNFTVIKVGDDGQVQEKATLSSTDTGRFWA